MNNEQTPVPPVADVFARLADLLDETRGQYTAVAELLAAGQVPKAMEALRGCLAVWGAAEESIQKAACLAELDPAGTVGPDSPAQLIHRLRDCLQRLQQDLQNRDFVAVADALESQMPSLTDGWQRMLRHAPR